MKTEIRTCSVELRADPKDADEMVLEGLAASYNQVSSDLGGFREQIAPGAFRRSLEENHDVKMLLNHDPNHILGRVHSGTLTLKDKSDGLHFRCQLDPNNSSHQNVYASVKRGDLAHMSFAFSLPQVENVTGRGQAAPPENVHPGDVWDYGEEKGKKFVRRTLKDVKLHDVSVVVYPAYSGPDSTAVAARCASMAAHCKPTDTRSDADIDDSNRARCAALGREIEADLQRRIEAAGRAVAEDRARGEI
jgi:Escherichia/Staphylococcus phage prohead protease